MTVVEFLLARIAEDEQVTLTVAPSTPSALAQPWRLLWLDEYDIIHFDDHSRVLAECAAKRAIIMDRSLRESGRETLSTFGQRVAGYLAMPYATHPDYDQAWSVG